MNSLAESRQKRSYGPPRPEPLARGRPATELPARRGRPLTFATHLDYRSFLSASHAKASNLSTAAGVMGRCPMSRRSHRRP